MKYEEGQDAWFSGKSINDCPYAIASVDYQNWCRGYRDAEWKYNYQTQM